MTIARDGTAWNEMGEASDPEVDWTGYKKEDKHDNQIVVSCIFCILKITIHHSLYNTISYHVEKNVCNGDGQPERRDTNTADSKAKRVSYARTYVSLPQ